ncbi:hypothetical protein HPO96_12465 [Kribbella sandramycini]|uniref:Uncharacterized protein n=1 Tax=Kribbella sandramycini TaxID=60450 RepID=A0A7Y4NYK4_9ACTN|nr:hypothetical protein [Kribbella sandramycini]MBB6569100.1 hypothetical protein [Kribbella sandramycini]NOL41057.1 hypothetical protein [Kribbella sandramycini]
MIKLALVLLAGYAGYKVAYHSEDGRHYGKVGDRTLRTSLSLLIGALAAGITYVALLRY